MQLSGMAINYDEVAWRTAGDGSFSDTTALDAIYTAGPQDIADGAVVLSLIAKGTIG